MIDFEKANTKAEIGEQIVSSWLKDKGWILYGPTYMQSHPIDIVAYKFGYGWRFYDVKTKARMNKAPLQGIDVRDYVKYKALAQASKWPVWLVFVDDKNGDVHAADINKLSKGTIFEPPNVQPVIAWDISEMALLFRLTSEQIQALSEFDQRGYEFEPS